MKNLSKSAFRKGDFWGNHLFGQSVARRNHLLAYQQISVTISHVLYFL